jgi:DNA-binding protein HU-beta
LKIKYKNEYLFFRVVRVIIINIFSILVTCKHALSIYICLRQNQLFNLKNQKTMNKGDLITKMASDSKISKAQAESALNSFMKCTEDTLKKGGKITLVGFGTYSVSKRAARNGRNPQTGKPIKISARTVVKFKAGKQLATKVNKK